MLTLSLVAVQFAVPFWTIEAQREDVKRVLKRLEEDTDRFSKSLDSALDHSTLKGTRAEDEINGYVHQFEEQQIDLRIAITIRELRPQLRAKY